MTVKELRDLLANEPDDATVLVEYYHYGIKDSFAEDIEKVVREEHRQTGAPLVVLYALGWDHGKF